MNILYIYRESLWFVLVQLFWIFIFFCYYSFHSFFPFYLMSMHKLCWDFFVVFLVDLSKCMCSFFYSFLFAIYYWRRIWNFVLFERVLFIYIYMRIYCSSLCLSVLCLCVCVFYAYIIKVIELDWYNIKHWSFTYPNEPYLAYHRIFFWGSMKCWITYVFI